MRITPTYFKPMLAGNFSALQSDSSLGWSDYSDGVNSTILDNGCLHMEDSNSANWTQTKAINTQYVFPNNFKIEIIMRIDKLCDSFVLDTLADDEDIQDNHSVSNNVDDADGANATGFSFVVSHHTAKMRAVFAIVKSKDYETTKNIEIWKVNSGLPIATNYVEFSRVYVGRDIEIGKQFKIEVEYEVYDTVSPRKSYYMTIKKDGKTLSNREICAHNSPYGGNNSILMQVKGTSERPTEVYVYSVSAPVSIPSKTFPKEVANLGVVGQKTADVSINTVVNSRAQIYLVMLGTSDYIASVSATDFKTNLSNIVAKLKKYGKVILLTPPPNQSNGFHLYIDKVREVAHDQSVGLIDIYDGYRSNSQPSRYSGSWLQNFANTGLDVAPSGLVPTYFGCDFIAQKVFMYLKENSISEFTKIACVGDDITKGVGIIGEATSNGQTWPARLKAKLN